MNPEKGGGSDMDIMPEWMADLDEEDAAFIKRFLLASGSLKEVAGQYGVTYPTVRLRLDKLIQKIRVYDTVQQDPYIALAVSYTHLDVYKRQSETSTLSRALML